MENQQELELNQGSVWRKWDLHIHPKNTNEFHQSIEQSDISVFGIAGYFFINNYKAFIKEFSNKYPNSKKIFFPNIELRLDNKNTKNEYINIHIIFSNIDKTVNKIDDFLTRLPLVNQENKHVSQISTKKELGVAMINIDELSKQLSISFKDDEYILVGVANGLGGISAGNKPRDKEITEKIDRKCSAFFGIKNNTELYLNKTGRRENLNLLPKAILWASDHIDENSKIGGNFTWIKADTTFEGLKQITYEPESRVKIQDIKPEEKPGYQVIKSIEINNLKIKQKIFFNPNLNTIIGGRSTGKSTLLKIIKNKIIQNDSSEDYLKNYISSSTIEWADGEKNKERDIDFFKQSYMFEIAEDETKLKKLVEDILKNKELDNLKVQYDSFCIQNKQEIEKDINKLFQFNDDLIALKTEIKNLGDKEGIKTEIKNLEEKQKKIREDNKFTEQDREIFLQILNDITKIENDIKINEANLSNINIIQNINLFNNNIDFEINKLSENIKNYLSSELEKLKTELNHSWKGILDYTLKYFQKTRTELLSKIEKKKQLGDYKKGIEFTKNNKEFQSLSEQLNKEKKKITDIKTKEQIRDNINKEILNLKNLIIESNSKYFEKLNNLQNEANIKEVDITVEIRLEFKEQELEEMLKSSINLQSDERKIFIDDFVKKYRKLIEKYDSNILIEVLQLVAKKKLHLKQNSNYVDLAKKLLAVFYFDYNYILNYQDDSFYEMSEGKKAFVVLKLLLEFSDRKSPILIDQPEDNLDNRSIYEDLVTYLKDTKTKRQIILVTHNANIVVNADAENIIVANQHGKNTENKDDKKFDYTNNSLESTKADKNSDYILEKITIKEHVCQILEGGKEAFKNRENKYEIK